MCLEVSFQAFVGHSVGLLCFGLCRGRSLGLRVYFLVLSSE